MLPIVAALVCSLPSLHVTAQDTPVLRRLEHALSDISDKKTWFVRFERQCPPSDIPEWRRLQRRAAPNSKQYSELSFALAYYGRDYQANLRRLTRPNRLHSRGYIAYNKEYPGNDFDANWTGWGETWLPLNLLYLKRHDLASLKTWLDQAYDGAPAEESQDELGALWTRHKTDMLRAAGKSFPRAVSLADALVFADYSSRGIRIVLREAQTLTHSPDIRVAVAARRVAEQVQSRTKEVDTFDRNNKAKGRKVG